MSKYDVDFNRVGLLLHIPEMQAKVAPTMTYLASAAMAELKEINDAIGAEVKADLEAKQAEAAKAVVAPQRTLQPGEPMPGPAHKVVVAGADGEPVENEVEEDGVEGHTTAEVEKEEGVDLSGDGLVGTDNEDTELNRLPVVDETPTNPNVKRRV